MSFNGSVERGESLFERTSFENANRAINSTFRQVVFTIPETMGC
jgi:hypothetical protein